MTSLDIPAGIVQINSNAFSYCENFDYIYIHATEPFFLWDDAFPEINDHVHIVVPCNCIEAFEAQGLVTIVDEMGRVARTLFVDNKQTVDLQGLSSGVYFVKAGNAVKKIFVK